MIPDPAQESLLEEVESDAARELREYETRGLPGLNLDQTKRVLSVMRQIQKLKLRHSTTIPVALRQQVSRLRKETGLPLKTSLL